MSATVRIILYAVLAICLAVFAWRFASTYSKSASDSSTALTSEEPLNEEGRIRTPSKRSAQWMTYAILGFFSLVGLSILAARDISRFAASRAEEFIVSDDGEGLRDPEYEEAEKVWVNGNHLEAIQLMRDYLKENPRQLHAALRIAEIYEKDLGNHLAAALEYEEVLKQKLPPERWGWAAIHLANLYSGKLGKPEQAVALLRRIDAEYGETAAARKARQRLKEITGEEAPAAPPSDQQSFKLPPGFTPKE